MCLVWVLGVGALWVCFVWVLCVGALCVCFVWVRVGGTLAQARAWGCARVRARARPGYCVESYIIVLRKRYIIVL